MRTVLNLFPVKSNHLPGTLCRRAVYLSPAPHAEPQAAGFSFGVSPAPHAEPQAAGFSFGVSPAPHAVPQAEAAVSSLSFVHPIRFESAMILASILLFGAFAVP